MPLKENLISKRAYFFLLKTIRLRISRNKKHAVLTGKSEGRIDISYGFPPYSLSHVAMARLHFCHRSPQINHSILVAWSQKKNVYRKIFEALKKIFFQDEIVVDIVDNTTDLSDVVMAELDGWIPTLPLRLQLPCKYSLCVNSVLMSI